MSRFACQASFQLLIRAHSANVNPPPTLPRKQRRVGGGGLISAIHLPWNDLDPRLKPADERGQMTRG
jgi:hypothetical protein